MNDRFFVYLFFFNKLKLKKLPENFKMWNKEKRSVVVYILEESGIFKEKKKFPLFSLFGGCTLQPSSGVCCN